MFPIIPQGPCPRLRALQSKNALCCGVPSAGERSLLIARSAGNRELFSEPSDTNVSHGNLPDRRNLGSGGYHD